MFQELMPLLAQRMVIITLSRVSDEEMHINVVPKPLKSNQQDDNAALTTPLSITGTAKEIDDQLSLQLVEFVGTHLELSSTLKRAKEQMDTAAKAAKEAAKKPANTKSSSGSTKSTSPGAARVQAEAETNEKSDDSQSPLEPAQVTAPGTGSVGSDASTGCLFDVGPKDDN